MSETAPSPFDAVIGQERACRLMSRLAESDTAPHALLLCGPDGTGRTATALAYVKALYKRTTGDGAVRRIESLSHPDMSVMFPLTKPQRSSEQAILRQIVSDPYGCPRPENAALHSIEQVRDLIARFARSAYEGKWRAAVILHAEKMRDEAANALLKVLEEPPQDSVIVLTAAAPDAVLQTIVSRCQVVRFPQLAEDVLTQTLVAARGLDETRAAFIARACGGSYRRALEMADSDSDDIHDRACKFLEALLWGKPFGTYTAIEGLVGDKERTMAILSASALWLRDVMLYQQGLIDATSAQERKLARLGEVFDAERIRETLAAIEELRDMNRRNVALLAPVVAFWNRLKAYAEAVPA